MQYCIIYNLRTGEVFLQGDAFATPAETQNPPEGFSALDLPFGIHPNDLGNHIPELKEALKAKAVTYREKIIGGGCETSKGRVETDSMTLLKITGSSLGALVSNLTSAPFSVTWTLTDGSYILLSAEEMIGLGMEVLAHINNAHEACRLIFDEIDEKETVEDLLKIDIKNELPEESE